MAPWLSSRRGRRPAGFVAALAGFALLCGVLLLIGNSWSCRSEPPVQLEQARQQLRSALGRVQTADQAIAKQNFGQARATLSEVRSALQQALSDLTPAKERRPATP